MHVCSGLVHMSVGASGGWRPETSESPGLVFQPWFSVSCPVWVLRTELQSSGITVCTFNCWAISLAFPHSLLHPCWAISLALPHSQLHPCWAISPVLPHCPLHPAPLCFETLSWSSQAYLKLPIFCLFAKEEMGICTSLTHRRPLCLVNRKVRTGHGGATPIWEAKAAPTQFQASWGYTKRQTEQRED